LEPTTRLLDLTVKNSRAVLKVALPIGAEQMAAS
jgi:hypothetical protein